MNKCVIFDSEDCIGNWLEDEFCVRPHFEVILEYCFISKIRVYIYHKNRDLSLFPDNLKHFVVDFFCEQDAPPQYPDLLITSDEDFGKKFSSFLLPKYDVGWNKFASLSLAGKTLDSIKDKIVLSKIIDKQVKAPQEKPEKQEDVTNFGFSL